MVGCDMLDLMVSFLPNCRADCFLDGRRGATDHLPLGGRGHTKKACLLVVAGSRLP